MKIVDNLVCNSFNTFYNAEGHIIFDPPLYVQRYNVAINAIKHELFKKKIQHIVEFGCAEMKFFNFIKTSLMDRDLWIKLIDIDAEQIMRCKNSSVVPLIMDHVKRREHFLNVELWKGDIGVYNPNFVNVDCVVCIELIEHLYPNTLNQVPHHVFENLKPKIAIFSTPNCEYNKVFDLDPGQFRHNDHKFEWTRSQFQDWCDNICERFPDYMVQLEGIGKPPQAFDVNEIGFSSQFALFIQKDFMTLLQEESNDGNDAAQRMPSDINLPCENYELLDTIDYPVFKDTRDMIEKINDEVCYHVNRYKYMGDLYYNADNDRIEIPIDLVARACWEVTSNEQDVMNVIRERFQVENDFIILENNEESCYSDDQGADDEQIC